MRQTLLITAWKFVVTFAAIAATPICRAEIPTNQLTEAEKRSGWQLLFDGQSADQWRNYRKEDLSAGWNIEEGALLRSKSGAGDIITKEQFEFFELSIQYRISKGGNSGVMFHVTEDEPQPWKTGPEVQVQDNVDGHDPQKAGWLYQLYQPTVPGWVRNAESNAGIDVPEYVDATRPAGQWNELYLRIAPGQCEVAMNGVSYFKFRKGDDDWNKRVAKSKFAAFASFGKPNKGHICLQDHGNEVAFRNIKLRKLAANGSIPNPVDGKLAVRAVPAFPKLKWAGWQSAEETGTVAKMRPLSIVPANDGTNRLFAATQRGVVHVFENDPLVEQTQVFLDLTERVKDWRKGNEEGLLALAFHPQFKKNGQFFVYYTAASEPPTSIVSRFSLASDTPDRAEPNSEEVLLKIEQPFSNHNGGSIAFGPDGYLYIGLGDGGSRNDPLENGQNLSTLLGSILRIDVDQKPDGRNYGIPADNPFVQREGARPEIYAYGFRNIWRLAFDPQTGALWAGDVGQDLWEEIDIVKRGGNYGWNSREGTHQFGNSDQKFVGSPIDPIWEYDHQIGKSITGGVVYRGKDTPALDGMYLYADYVTGRVWALDYDQKTGKVRRNMSLQEGGIPVLAFAQDQAGEVFYMIESHDGQSIFRFVSAE
ncbi:MAG: PQQ-dependent sugar dehydrogenase [Planctomycetales bacterium]|nr:PQQ-dependent sugar dehydrogenase [Planctomycetales bacterium]